MKKELTQMWLEDSNVPTSLKEILKSSTLVRAPRTYFIKHCASKSVVLTDHNSRRRMMGEFILGASDNLMICFIGQWTVVYDQASNTHVFIAATTKTIGFNTSSPSEELRIDVRLQERVLYRLNPIACDQGTYDFIVYVSK